MYILSRMDPSQCCLHLATQCHHDDTVLRNDVADRFQSEHVQDPPNLVVAVQFRDHTALEILQGSVHVGFILECDVGIGSVNNISDLAHGFQGGLFENISEQFHVHHTS